MWFKNKTPSIRELNTPNNGGYRMYTDGNDHYHTASMEQRTARIVSVLGPVINYAEIATIDSRPKRGPRSSYDLGTVVTKEIQELLPGDTINEQEYARFSALYIINDCLTNDGDHYLVAERTNGNTFRVLATNNIGFEKKLSPDGTRIPALFDHDAGQLPYRRKLSKSDFETIIFNNGYAQEPGVPIRTSCLISRLTLNLASAYIAELLEHYSEEKGVERFTLATDSAGEYPNLIHNLQLLREYINELIDNKRY